MVVKKKVKKKVSKKNIKSKKDFKSLDEKRKKSLFNVVKSLIGFVLFLVLYFVTPKTNPLEVIFGFGALITGALAVTFILIWLGIFLYMRTHKKK